MPINRHNYHPNWKDEIRPAILKRDNYRCKICGVPNRSRIIRTANDGFLEVDHLIERDARARGTKIIKVVLTVAHLNHITTDNRPENLMTMCQLHHLRHDHDHKQAMKQIANVWSVYKAIAMSSETGGEKYLPHLLVLARARRNQIFQLARIRAKRAHYGEKSQYDKDLKKLITTSRTEYFIILKRICFMLSEAFGITNRRRFFHDYWSSDTKIIARIDNTFSSPETSDPHNLDYFPIIQ